MFGVDQMPHTMANPAKSAVISSLGGHSGQASYMAERLAERANAINQSQALLEEKAASQGFKVKFNNEPSKGASR